MWADAFHNFTIILVSLFSKEAPDLHITLAEFYSNVYELSTVYEWQDAVLPMAIKAHTYIVSQQPTDLSKWVIPEKFQGRFCTLRTMIGIGSIIGASGAGGSKRRRSRSPAGARCVKSSGSNNLLISCDLFNKGGCNWPPCNRAHKCKKCGSRAHWLLDCTAKRKKRSWQSAESTGVVVEEVEVFEVASLANENDLYQFMRAYLCLPAPPRPNTSIKFRLPDASKLPLTNFPSPLKPSAWADLLALYPGGLRIHLPMILRFGAELRYKGPLNAFILSDNLASTLKDPAIIEKKLQEDLASGRVSEVQQLCLRFICSPLSLVSKHDGGWMEIHYLSHPRGKSVNGYIPDRAGEMRYKCFQEVLQLDTNTGWRCIILKRDVKDAFRNVPVAPQHQWLLGFRWGGKFYKETCLWFGLATAPFIFNLFAEALHWIIAPYLRWVICHYLDEFVAIFKADALPERLEREANAYIWLTDLLGLPRNDSKDCQGTEVIILGIEIDTSSFTIWLPEDKLEKAIRATLKVLSQKTVSFIDIHSLVGFLSLCSQAVRLGRVSMRRLWDFINHYPRGGPKSTIRRIPAWLREDLE